MKTLLFALILAAPAGAAQADATEFCEEMWFARNAVFHQAGYCFGSPLGQAVFGNAGCNGAEVRLTPGQQKTVAYAKEQEAELGCNVDTAHSSLPHLQDLALRLQLTDIAPVNAWNPGSFLGYSGPVQALHAGHGASAPIVGELRPGDDILADFDEVGAPEGWRLFIIERGGKHVAMGWVHNWYENGGRYREAIP